MLQCVICCKRLHSSFLIHRSVPSESNLSRPAKRVRSMALRYIGDIPTKESQLYYASSRADILRIHLKTHSREKTYKCNQCDYASSQASDLSRHLATHTGEKTNKCTQCDFATSRAGNLRTHLKTHSGEKSNQCNQCDFASSGTDSLRTH